MISSTNSWPTGVTSFSNKVAAAISISSVFGSGVDSDFVFSLPSAFGSGFVVVERDPAEKEKEHYWIIQNINSKLIEDRGFFHASYTGLLIEIIQG